MTEKPWRVSVIRDGDRDSVERAISGNAAQLEERINVDYFELDSTPPDSWAADAVFLADVPSKKWRDRLHETPPRWLHWGGVGVEQLGFLHTASCATMLTTSRSVMATPVAEHAVALLLALCKHVPHMVDAKRDQNWLPRETIGVTGMRVVVVGLGAIGRRTCRLLAAIGARVTAVASHGRVDSEIGFVHGADELLSVAESAQALVIAAPFTAGTDCLVSADVLDAIPHGGIIVNVGRGRVIDQDALGSALFSGHLSGAALDVFRDEPLPAGDTLWSLPNVIVSPHMAARISTIDSEIALGFTKNLTAFIAGKPLRDAVDLRVGFVPGETTRRDGDAEVQN